MNLTKAELCYNDNVISQRHAATGIIVHKVQAYDRDV